MSVHKVVCATIIVFVRWCLSVHEVVSVNFYCVHEVMCASPHVTVFTW